MGSSGVKRGIPTAGPLAAVERKTGSDVRVPWRAGDKPRGRACGDQGPVCEALSPVPGTQLALTKCWLLGSLCAPACPSSTFLPGLVGCINRFFFWLLFTGRKENSNLSHKIFSYECRFKQHVQDWAIPRWARVSVKEAAVGTASQPPGPTYP